MKRAAKICNDAVTKHSKSVVGDGEADDDNGMFVYHNTNKCYKLHTHSGKLKSTEEKSASVEESVMCDREDEDSTSAGLRKILHRSVVH